MIDPAQTRAGRVAELVFLFAVLIVFVPVIAWGLAAILQLVLLSE